MILYTCIIIIIIIIIIYIVIFSIRNKVNIKQKKRNMELLSTSTSSASSSSSSSASISTASSSLLLLDTNNDNDNENMNIKIEFNCLLQKPLNNHYSVYLIGSINEFGNWNLYKSIELIPSSLNNSRLEWSIKLDLNFNKTTLSTINYKYFIAKKYNTNNNNDDNNGKLSYFLNKIESKQRELKLINNNLLNSLNSSVM
jgi:hypothetical protein